MRKTIVPKFSSSFCAWSMFFLDIGRDYVRSYLNRTDKADLDTINKLYEDMADSHGAGRWRGSPGIIWEGVNESGDCKFIGGPWSGFATQAKGQQGGEATPLNKAYILRGNKRIDILQPHLPLELKRGDHLVTLSGGGAGIGKPENRDPEAVMADVRNELVSLEMARKVYKVAIKPETFEIDQAETAKLRTSSLL